MDITRVVAHMFKGITSQDQMRIPTIITVTQVRHILMGMGIIRVITIHMGVVLAVGIPLVTRIVVGHMKILGLITIVVVHPITDGKEKWTKEIIG
jgi:hypothetical protein